MIAFTLSVIFGIAIEVLQGLYTTTRREDILDVGECFWCNLAIFTIVIYYNSSLDKN
jgi:hypothetical protein